MNLNTRKWPLGFRSFLNRKEQKHCNLHVWDILWCRNENQFFLITVKVLVVQSCLSLSHVWLFAIPWTVAHHALNETVEKSEFQYACFSNAASSHKPQQNFPECVSRAVCSTGVEQVGSWEVGHLGITESLHLFLCIWLSENRTRLLAGIPRFSWWVMPVPHWEWVASCFDQATQVLIRSLWSCDCDVSILSPLFHLFDSLLAAMGLYFCVDVL